jgi:uncharacterized membrane protein YdjX (TVP38/TMEM64 family)
VLLGIALLAATSDFIYQAMFAAVVWLEPYATSHRAAGMLVFAGLAAVSALLAFFSSTVLVPVAVHAWGEPVTAVLLWSGWMVGGIGAYAAGKWLGRPLVRSLAGADKLEFYQAKLGRSTPFGVVLLFHLALQSEVPALVLGTLGYRFRLFVLALGLAELPYAVGTIYLGSFLLERRTLPLVLGGVVAVVAAVWAVRAFNRALREDGG